MLLNPFLGSVRILFFCFLGKKKKERGLSLLFVKVEDGKNAASLDGWKVESCKYQEGDSTRERETIFSKISKGLISFQK